MSRSVLRVVWYRFHATFARRVGGYFALAVLVGLLGGVAMASVAAARSTQSSFPAFVARTNPSDLGVIDLRAATGGGGASIVPTLAGLAHVKRVASWDAPNSLTVRPDGTPTGANANAQVGGVFAVVSRNGLFTKQDRVTVVQGRMLDPTRADEAVASVVAARALGLHVGDVTRQGFYTNAQSNSPDFGTAKIRPVFMQAVKVVGIVKFNNEVVQDDIDRLPTYVVLSPALARRLAQCCGGGGDAFVGLQLDNGRRDVAAVEREIARSLPTAAVTSISSVQVAKAERAIEPESIALGVFGVIAALAALLIAGQVIGRQLRFGADDLSVLRSLGAGPALTVVDGLVGDRRRGRPRCVTRGRRRGRALAVGTARTGSRGRACASHRVRLDGARPRTAGAHRDAQRGGVRARVPRRAAPGRPPAPAISVRGFETGAGGDALGAVADRGDRDPLRRRAGKRLERGAGALGDRGRRARDRRRRRHPDLRRQPQHPRVAAPAVRVELELRAAIGLLGNFEHPREVGGVSSRPRQEHRRVDGRLLRVHAN